MSTTSLDKKASAVQILSIHETSSVNTPVHEGLHENPSRNESSSLFEYERFDEFESLEKEYDEYSKLSDINNIVRPISRIKSTRLSSALEIAVIKGDWGTHIVYARNVEDMEAHMDRMQTTDSRLHYNESVATDYSRYGGVLSRYKLAAQTGSRHSEQTLWSANATAVSSGVFCGVRLVEAALFAIVLEHSIRQIKIYEACNQGMKIRRMRNDMEHLLDLKFGIIDDNYVRPELDGIDPNKLDCDQYKLVKLLNDRNTLAELLQKSYDEMVVTHSFNILRNTLLTMVADKDFMLLMGQEEARNKIKTRELARQLRQQRVLNRNKISEADYNIEILKAAIEDVALNGDIRARYVRCWQSARDEQHSQIISETEAVPGDKIEYLKQTSDDEYRVHTELEAFITVDIEDTLAKLDEWVSKYERDLEQIDLEMQYKKNDYQVIFEKRVDLEKTIAEHEEAMTAWNAFKDAREEERKYREKMNTSARAVQAWWRGLLVRKQLGPFKVKKEKHKKKKKFF